MQAVRVFETMQSCAANEPDCRCNPDLVTYSSIISACQKSLQWQKALDVYEVKADRPVDHDVNFISEAFPPSLQLPCSVTVFAIGYSLLWVAA